MSFTNPRSVAPLQILIIGGSGFLSGTIARLAVAQGHRVWIVTRGKKAVPEGVKTIVADRQNRAEFAQKITDIDIEWDLVVDAIPYTADDARQDVAVFAGRAKRLVFVSTDFVYDPQHRENPQNETNAVYTTVGYGGLKREAEIVLENTAFTKLPWTILRPSHIYGLGSWLGCLPLHGRDPQLVDHLLANQPLRLVGGGKFLQHPIYAPDLAVTILSAAGAEADGIYNVAGPDILESQAYYRVLGQLLEREITIEAVPLADFLSEHPEKAPFCCDRVYDLASIKASQLAIPATSLKNGMAEQLKLLLK